MPTSSDFQTNNEHLCTKCGEDLGSLELMRLHHRIKHAAASCAAGKPGGHSKRFSRTSIFLAKVFLSRKLTSKETPQVSGSEVHSSKSHRNCKQEFELSEHERNGQPAIYAVSHDAVIWQLCLIDQLVDSTYLSSSHELPARNMTLSRVPGVADPWTSAWRCELYHIQVVFKLSHLPLLPVFSYTQLRSVVVKLRGLNTLPSLLAASHAIRLELLHVRYFAF